MKKSTSDECKIFFAVFFLAAAVLFFLPQSAGAALLTGKTPANYSLPEGWTTVRTQDFENGCAGSNVENCSMGQSSVPSTATRAHSGTRALQGTYTQDGDSVVYITYPGTYAEVYLSWYDYVDSTALFTDEYFIADFMKRNPDDSLKQELIIDYIWCGQNNPNNTNCKLDIQAGGEGAGYSLIGTYDLNTSIRVLPLGQWVQWEVHYRPNTPGNSDGFMRVYMTPTDTVITETWMNINDFNLNGAADMNDLYAYIGGTYTQLIWSQRSPDDVGSGACNFPAECGNVSDGCRNYMGWAVPFNNPRCGPTHPNFNRYIDDVIVMKTDGGGGGGGGGTCTPNWSCTSWSTCSSGTQTRSCTDSNNCGTSSGKPTTTQSCNVAASCGDGTCNGTESCSSCSQDCGACSSKTYTLTDFTNLVQDWLKSLSGSPADTNLDNKVNSRDLGIMMSNWETSIPGTNSITVRARGDQGDETIDLKINNTTVKTWTLTTSYQDYSTTATISDSDEVRVYFTNDNSGTRDVQIDYLKIDSATYQTENQTINTGAWNYDTAACGGAQSEWLHCNGYIQFQGGTISPQETCGNGSCSTGETCTTCPEDCGQCQINQYCGDQSCNNGETCSSCPGDCGSCGGGVDRTKNGVLNYITGLPARSNNRILSGNLTAFMASSSENEINENWNSVVSASGGKVPAVMSWDFGTIGYPSSFDLNKPYTIPMLADHWNAGGLVIIGWHANNPVDESWSWFGPGPDVNFADVYTSGNPRYNNFRAGMEQVAAGLKMLQDQGVVVLFRPFHEMNGDWFWWSAGGKADQYKSMWKYIHNFLTVEKGLNNLLWVYAPYANYGGAMDYYPGNDYVDIVGIDYYSDYFSTPPEYTDLLTTGKPFMIAELGQCPGNYDNPSGCPGNALDIINQIKSNLPKTSIIINWGDSQSLRWKSNVPGYFNDPWIIDRDELKNEL